MKIDLEFRDEEVRGQFSAAVFEWRTTAPGPVAYDIWCARVAPFVDDLLVARHALQAICDMLPTVARDSAADFVEEVSLLLERMGYDVVDGEHREGEDE